ncbi:MAG: trypsin-like peptidase domain-containing protein [Clostridiales Family XIII bacterium]|jgi:S1-C subfamily serine protease|nr:trypsin-like peptidase domain-containing protein [Clostridiales Family XIII bacterium]
MSRTVIIMEDGKIIQRIEEENLEGIVIEDGKLKAQEDTSLQKIDPEAPAYVGTADVADTHAGDMSYAGSAETPAYVGAADAEAPASIETADAAYAAYTHAGDVPYADSAVDAVPAAEAIASTEALTGDMPFGSDAAAYMGDTPDAGSEETSSAAEAPVSAGDTSHTHEEPMFTSAGTPEAPAPASAADMNYTRREPIQAQDIYGAQAGQFPHGGQDMYSAGNPPGFISGQAQWRQGGAVYTPNPYNPNAYNQNPYNQRMYAAGNQGANAGVQGAQTGRQEYAWRESSAQQTEKKKKQSLNIKRIAIGALGLIVAVTAGFGGGMAALNTRSYDIAAGVQQITINPTEQISITEAVAAKVIPSVVGITSKATREIDTFPFGFGSYNQEIGGVGTGIIVDEGGYILTNSHVIIDGEVDSIVVLLPDGREVDGNVLWNERSMDLAIVKVDANNLNAAQLGDSDEMRIGAYVAAIGNPLGLDFRSSVSQGVVSGLDRKIMASDSSGLSGRPVQMEGLMQVDAAINQGNSGGPLVNSKGEVVGINTAKTQDGEGIGFAIPINTAKPIVESVKKTGEFHRVYIGVSTNDVSALINEYPHLDLGTTTGAYVASVTQGSPAERAGIKKDDIIVKVNDMDIRTSSELAKKLLGFNSGDQLEVTIIREKQTITVTAILTDNLN